MKKIMVLIVIVSFVFSGGLMAQGLGFGAKAGMNLAKFSGDDADFEGYADPSSVFGITAGGFVNYPITDALSVQPEFLFTQKGSSYSLDEEGFEWDFKFKMNWIDVPILAVYDVMDNVKVFAGPLFEIFMSGKIKSEISYMGVTEDDEDDIEGEDVNSFGMGLVFGAMYMVTDNIGVDLRYALGLTSMDPEDNLKNNGLQLTASYYLKNNK